MARSNSVLSQYLSPLKLFLAGLISQRAKEFESQSYRSFGIGIIQNICTKNSNVLQIFNDFESRIKQSVHFEMWTEGLIVKTMDEKDC